MRPLERQGAVQLPDSIDDFGPLVTQLELGADGIYYSASSGEAVSYPDEHYDEARALEDDSFWFAHRARCICELMARFPAGGCLFDVGAGNGFMTYQLERSGIPAAALEPSTTASLNARTRGVSRVICSTLQGSDFEPGTLPAVGMFDVLEHIERDGEFLDDVRHYLVPGGRLYLTVPAYQWLWGELDVVSGHYRRYTTNNLSQLLTQHGFEVEFHSYLFSFLPLPIFLLRTVAAKLGLSSSPKTRAKEHGGSRVFGALVRGLCGLEQACLRRGWRIPIGSSCLAVARKR